MHVRQEKNRQAGTQHWQPEVFGEQMHGSHLFDRYLLADDDQWSIRLGHINWMRRGVVHS